MSALRHASASKSAGGTVLLAALTSSSSGAATSHEASRRLTPRGACTCSSPSRKNQSSRHAPHSEGLREGMRVAVEAAAAGLAEARPFAPSKNDPQLGQMELTYVRLVGNLLTTSCNAAGVLELDKPDVEHLLKHATEARTLAKKHAKRAGREGMQSQQILPRLEQFIEAVKGTPVAVQ